jgi:yecA family protein
VKTLPVNFSDLALALEDQGGDLHVYYFDTETGKVLILSEDIDEKRLHEIREEGAGRFLRIEPMSSRRGYQIMEDFVRDLRPSRVREKLEWSLDGPKPFRRFKDALRGDDAIRRHWFDFHEARMRELAIEWLSDHHICPKELAIDDPRAPELTSSETVAPTTSEAETEAEDEESDQFEKPALKGEYEPLSEEEEAELIEFLDSLPKKGMSLAKLHGLCTALAAGPEEARSTDPFIAIAIVGGKLPIKDSEHAERISTLLRCFHNEIVEDLGSESFVPRLQPKDIEIIDIVSDIASWCQGFVLGMEQASSAWRPWFKDPRREKLVSLITRTAQIHGRPDTDGADAAGWRAHSVISDLVPLIASYWRFESALDELVGPQPIVAEPRVGGNEACPCGSGKKYKHCCGRTE